MDMVSGRARLSARARQRSVNSLQMRLLPTPGSATIPITCPLPARARVGSHWLLALVAMQIALGIVTLLLVVPIPLAAAHQAGAVLVFAAALNVAHALR